MYGIVLSAIATFSNFILSAVSLKFVFFTILFYVASEFIQFITACGCVPMASSISTALNTIPGSVWYFLNMFNFAQGITAVLSAYMVRFLIRRIPFFG